MIIIIITHYNNITYFAAFKDTVNATLPRGYVIPARMDTIIQLLQQQGVMVTKLDKNTRFSGESFFIESYKKSPRKFEGHQMASIEGKFKSREMTANKGDYMVDLAQPLANLIFYMLEPQSDDGIVTWNFMDKYIGVDEEGFSPVDYLIFKYFKKY